MISSTNAVYFKKEIKLLWPIESGKFVMKTKQDNNLTHRIGLVYVEKNNELSRPIHNWVQFVMKTR